MQVGVQASSDVKGLESIYDGSVSELLPPSRRIRRVISNSIQLFVEARLELQFLFTVGLIAIENKKFERIHSWL